MVDPTAVLLCFMPFIAIGDEISDSVYLMSNWNKFANDSLKWTCFAFFWGPLLFHFLVAAIYFYAMEKGPYFSKAGFKPFFLVLYIGFLSWTKLMFFEQIQKTFKRNNNSPDGVNSFKMKIIFLSLQSIGEDFPQLIIQGINNSQTNVWDYIQIITYVFSVLALALSLFEIMVSCYKQQVKAAHINPFNDQLPDGSYTT